MDISFSSESSDSSLDEVVEIVDILERPRNFKNRPNAFEQYNESEFRQRFRLSKATVQVLIDSLSADLERNTERNFPLSPEDQVLISLRFYATGSFQELVADNAGVHKSTVSRTVQNTSRLIAELRPQFIKMPRTDDEIRNTKRDFYAIRGFPNVLGCIDGSHVKILSPGGENPELFRNRKTYFSINVQAVCNSKLLFQDIDARWPGSTHDSTMFNASYLCARLSNGEFGNGYLLGDSAYACTQHMMTPLLNPTTDAENRYNTSHIHTRNCIERAFGVWKRRFGCLANGLRTKLDNTLTIIIATAVLHNIAVLEGDFEIEQEAELNLVVDQNANNEQNVAGNAIRRSLIENVFN